MRRLRALLDLARLEADPSDRIRAEIAQCLLLQADGTFDAAYTRAETALALAYEQRDTYGQMAAITAICDLYLLRPLPDAPQVPPAARSAFLHSNLTRAAEWQTILLDMLDGLGDVLAGLPAANKLALIDEQLGLPDVALEMHQRTLRLATELGSRHHQATAWLYLGQWYSRQTRWPEALDAVTRCLALADEASKPAVRIALGEVYRAMELHAESLAQFELAYEQVRKTDDLLNQFTCLREIATARMKLGRRENAILALQEAIDVAHALELREEPTLRKQLAAWKAGGT
jgi:tetratricopeptide (TPR) repeat protein